MSRVIRIYFCDARVFILISLYSIKSLTLRFSLSSYACFNSKSLASLALSSCNAFISFNKPSSLDLSKSRSLGLRLVASFSSSLALMRSSSFLESCSPSYLSLSCKAFSSSSCFYRASHSALRASTSAYLLPLILSLSPI